MRRCSLFLSVALSESSPAGSPGSEGPAQNLREPGRHGPLIKINVTCRSPTLVPGHRLQGGEHASSSGIEDVRGHCAVSAVRIDWHRRGKPSLELRGAAAPINGATSTPQTRRARLVASSRRSTSPAPLPRASRRSRSTGASTRRPSSTTVTRSSSTSLRAIQSNWVTAALGTRLNLHSTTPPASTLLAHEKRFGMEAHFVHAAPAGGLAGWRAHCPRQEKCSVRQDRFEDATASRSACFRRPWYRPEPVVTGRARLLSLRRFSHDAAVQPVGRLDRTRSPHRGRRIRH